MSDSSGAASAAQFHDEADEPGAGTAGDPDTTGRVVAAGSAAGARAAGVDVNDPYVSGADVAFDPPGVRGADAVEEDLDDEAPAEDVAEEDVDVDDLDEEEDALDEEDLQDDQGARVSVDEDVDEDEADTDVADSGNGGRAGDLFRQSEIAADYVEGLLDILDYDGDIDELVSGGRPVVEVVGGRLNALVGTRGATLEALQELARLAVFRQTGTPSRLLLDVGGYRATRRKELAAIAKNAAEKVKEYGEPVRLEPMSAFERKCVHDVINALAGVESESEGVEPSRRIVVRPVP